MLKLPTIALFAYLTSVPALRGRLAFLTCDYPSCDYVQLKSLDIQSSTLETLWTFPKDSVDDAYGNNVFLGDADTIILNLQYDSNAQQGVLVPYSLSHKKVGLGKNISACVVLMVDPVDAQGLLCLRIVEGGPNGEDTELRHIDRATGRDSLTKTLRPSAIS